MLSPLRVKYWCRPTFVMMYRSPAGAPSLRDPNARGDQFIEVQVTLPKVISEETKELLRKYAQMNNENPRVAMGLE